MHGLRHNGCTLPHRANTFVDVLAAGGYSTASIGKSHLQSFLDLPAAPADGSAERLIDEAWQSEAVDFDEEQPDKYASDALYAVTVPYYGYQHVDLVTGHGDQCRGNYEQWFRANCPDWKALTAGMVTMIDDQVGRMVATLKEAGLFENTIVIFNSDHGDYLGDFDLLLKEALPFRSVTQVPMIWSDPMQQSVARTQALASTIDISASILARAGLAPYNGIQGRSFLDRLEKDVPHRDALLVEFNDGASRLGFVPSARVRSLRTKEWRFTTYQREDWGELYDLRNDPRETHNLWDVPEFAEVKAEMSLEMIDHLTTQMDASPRAQRRA